MSLELGRVLNGQKTGRTIALMHCVWNNQHKEWDKNQQYQPEDISNPERRNTPENGGG